MAKFVQEGQHIDYTSVGAVPACEPVVFGDRVFVPSRALEANKLGTLSTTGVFELDKTTSQAWTAGAKLYYDPATKKVTNVAGALKVIGYAAAAAGAADTTGLVLLGV